MFSVIEAPLDQDLSEFSRLLWQQRISHRVVRLDDRQVLALPKEAKVQEVMALYERWRAGEIIPAQQDNTDIGGYFDLRGTLHGAFQAFTAAPLTMILVGVCLVLAFATRLGDDRALVQIFLYPDFSRGTSVIHLDRVIENFSLVQFLKMVSPMLLHFSLLHIAFNMLWLWELGKRIEAVQPSWAMAILVVVLALVSNTIQYFHGGGNNFGGMSGVVYGLFAYIWMWQLFDPAKGLNLPGALIFFMLLSLLIITLLGLDMIADAAHVGGLVCGLVYGASVAIISRIRRVMATGRSTY